jgi:DNA-binding response OmpR family regulator
MPTKKGDSAVARVLLVEDDRDVRPLMEHIIYSDGYHVTAAETVANGLSLLETQPFDLVVTDVNLPDGSGLKVADKAKELGVAMLVVTGHGLSLQPGALANYDYLLKPLHANELLKAIKQRLPRDDGQIVPFPKPT